MPKFRFPAEWEEHEATWLAWPHHEPDWPGKFETIPWVYAEIVRLLSESERVEILCNDETSERLALKCLGDHGVKRGAYRLHVVPTDRSWVRDSGPTGVIDEKGKANWIRWKFNAWAKYDNCTLDSVVAEKIATLSERKSVQAVLANSKAPMVLEGGSIETDGEGTLLTTEECLLSVEQIRNPGLDQAGYEAKFKEYLGIEKTIWLGRGIVGDDTHGHIDDIARFVSPGRVVTAVENSRTDPNHQLLEENKSRLTSSRDALGRSLEVIPLPLPKPVMFEGERLPASYLNFYIGNRVVLVPTFNDPADRCALNLLADLFPERSVVGLHSVDLVLGLGTLHCLSQQQPRSKG